MVIKKHFRKIIWGYRKATSGFRSLPDFLIIGGHKCGTTSLFHYLSQHPQISPSIRKEINFFNNGPKPNLNFYKKGINWYKAHFPSKLTLRDQQVLFEASPDYIFHPLVPKRIYECNPKIKLIVLLRNPTERAISHYFQAIRRNKEHLPILEAFLAEDKRLNPIIQKNDFDNLIFVNYSYKSRGLYKKQLERYFKYFSISQFQIVKSETFFANPNKTLSKIFHFLNVDAKYEIKDLIQLNKGSNKEKVNQKVYEHLNEFFYHPNQSLYAMIGKDFKW